MSAMDDALPTPMGGFDNRVSRLEWIVPGLRADLTTTLDQVEKITSEQAVQREVQARIREDVRDLRSTLNKLTWAVVTMALSIAGSAVILAATIASH